MIVTYKIEISIFAKECKIYVYIIKKSKFYELFFFSIIKQITIIKKIIHTINFHMQLYILNCSLSLKKFVITQNCVGVCFF